MHTHIFPVDVVKNRERHFDGESSFHLLYSSPKSRLITAEDLVRAMDADGVDRAVLCGFPWNDPYRLSRHNDAILEAALLHAPRLIPFACVNPAHPQALREAERALSAGAAGLGELAIYGHCDQGSVLEVMRELAHLTAARRAVLLVHANEPVGHQYPGKSPLSLDFYYELARVTRGVPLVLAHWGGGIFFYEMLKKETSDTLGHVLYDTAASPYLYRRGIYRRAVEILGPERILFGSDHPLIGQTRCLQEVRDEDLTEGAFEAICGGNAARLLGIA